MGVHRELLVAAVGLLLLCLFAMVVVWALWRRSRGAAVRLIANAEEEARRIAASAEIEGQRTLKDADIVARERLLAARTEFERETRDLRMELTTLGDRLEKQEQEITESKDGLTEREQAIGTLESEIQEREGQLSGREQELEAAITEQRSRLEQIAGLTVDQAKAELMR